MRYDNPATTPRELSGFAAVIVEGTDTGLSVATERLADMKAHIEGRGTVGLYNVQPDAESFVASLTESNLGELFRAITRRNGCCGSFLSPISPTSLLFSEGAMALAENGLLAILYMRNLEVRFCELLFAICTGIFATI